MWEIDQNWGCGVTSFPARCTPALDNWDHHWQSANLYPRGPPRINRGVWPNLFSSRGKRGKSDGFELSIALDIGGEEMALLNELKAILPTKTPPQLEQFRIGEVTEMFHLGIASNSVQNSNKSVNARTEYGSVTCSLYCSATAFN